MTTNEVRISVQVGDDTTRGLAAVRASIDRIRADASRDIHMNVDVDTTAARAEIDALRLSAGRSIHLDVSGGGSLSQKLAAFKSLPSLLMQALPAASLLAGALAQVAVTVSAAGAGVAIFGLALIPQIQAIKSAATAQTTYNKAVEKYGKNSKQAQQALKLYKDSIAAMPPATAKAASAFANFKATLTDWSDKLAPKTMPVLTKALDTLSLLLPKLTPLVSGIAGVLQGLMDTLYGKVKKGELDHFIEMFTKFSVKSLKDVVRWSKELFDGIKSVVVSKTFQDFMDQVTKSGPGMVDTLKSLAEFVGKFIAAAGPMAGLQFKILGVLADDLNAIPMSVMKILAPTILGIAAALTILSLSPVGLWITGIVLLTVAITELVRHWDDVKKVIKVVFDWVKKNWPLLVEILAGPIGFVAVQIIKHWGDIKKGMKAAWDWIHRNVLTPIANFFTKTIPGAAVKLWHGIRDAFNSVKTKVGDVWKWVTDKSQKVVNFFKDMPGKITRATKGMFNGIKDAFKSAINVIIRGWNNLKFTIGKISVLGKTVFPGVTINTPNIPQLAHGGISSGGMTLVGENGPEMVHLPSGSHVKSNPDTMSNRGNGGDQRVILEFAAPAGTAEALLFEIFRKGIRVRGGNVQTVLGRN